MTNLTYGWVIILPMNCYTESKIERLNVKCCRHVVDHIFRKYRPVDDLAYIFLSRFY